MDVWNFRQLFIMAKANTFDRSGSIDQLAGVCIIFMIFTHICQLSYQTGWPVYIHSLDVFYFYMYFFFMKSGALFHEKILKNSIIQNTRRLLYPYFLFMLVGHVVHCIGLYLKGSLNVYGCFVQPLREIYHRGSCSGNLPLWFLLCLFLVKVTYNLLVKCHIKPLVILIVSFSVAVYLQNVEMQIGDIEIPYTIGAFFMSMSIYVFAVIMASRNVAIRGGQIITCILGAIFIASIFLRSPSVDIRSNFCRGFCLPWFLLSFLACLFFKRIFEYKSFCFSWLANVGRNSMTYYVWHWILLNITSIVYGIMGGTSNKMLWGLMVVACVLILPSIQYAKNKLNIIWIRI